MTQPTPTTPTIPSVSVKLPTLRSVKKLGRDAIAVAAASLATFLAGPHGVNALNLGPEESAVITGIFLFGYRWIRGVVGREPT